MGLDQAVSYATVSTISEELIPKIKAVADDIEDILSNFLIKHDFQIIFRYESHALKNWAVVTFKLEKWFWFLLEHKSKMGLEVHCEKSQNVSKF